MQRIIVAHHSHELANNLKDALENEWEIHVCTDSYPVADMLHYLKPDALVIDLNLHPKDGLTVLDENRLNLPPVILAMTNLVSPYILNTAEALGIGCVVRIPCSTAYIKEQLRELIDNTQGGHYGYHL